MRSALSAAHDHCVKAAAARGDGEYQIESPEDRHVVEELALLRAKLRRVGKAPEAVRRKGRHRHECKHQAAGVARGEAGEDQQSAEHEDSAHKQPPDQQ